MGAVPLTIMSANALECMGLVTLVSLLVRWCVSLFPYSGADKPPMFGDYEAQRHWQEITVNLPITRWYTNSTDNDLLYWGLDYPPLTAYHSYLVGLVAQQVDPAYVALNRSRGFESPDHKLFMRYTVFVADLLVFIPAVIFLMRMTRSSRLADVVRSGKLNFLALITYPGLVLIDYGHFQYNNISLGLFVAAAAAVMLDLDCFSSVLFCLALNYKQMELYHALPFFFYLLGKCWRKDTYQESLIKLSTIAGTVILSFIVVWAPYLESFSLFSQVLNRIFPIDRGLFEDKVASVWCCLSVLVKFKTLLGNSRMALLCLAFTGILSLPSCLNLFLNTSPRRFKYALVNVSLVFFLFSYHVHEKSILLVCVPACLLFSDEPFAVGWLLVVSQVSMVPLLDKDGLFTAAVALALLSALVYRAAASLCPPTSAISLGGVWGPRAIYASMAGAAVLTVAFKTLTPPHRFPDLFPLLIAAFSCAHFCLFAIYFHYRQFTLLGTDESLVRASRKQKGS